MLPWVGGNGVGFINYFKEIAVLGFCFVFFPCLLFWDTICLYSPGCLGTSSVDQGDLRLKRSVCLCLPTAGIKGVCHHYPEMFFKFDSPFLPPSYLPHPPFFIFPSFPLHSLWVSLHFQADLELLGSMDLCASVYQGAGITCSTSVLCLKPILIQGLILKLEAIILTRLLIMFI